MRVTTGTSPSLTGDSMPKSTKSHVRRATVAVTAALVGGCSPDDRLDDAGHGRVRVVGHHDPTVLGRAGATGRATSVPGDVRLYQTRQSLLGTHTWYRQVSGGRTVVNGWYAVHAWRTAASRSTTSARTPPPSCATATSSPTRLPSRKRSQRSQRTRPSRSGHR